MDNLIREYFKKGEKQGFSREYVRDILIQKGYDPVRVRMIYNSLSSKPSDIHPRRADTRFYDLPSPAEDEAHRTIRGSKNTLMIVAVITIGVLVLAGTAAFLSRFSDVVVLDEKRTADVQVALEEISTRDDEIEKKSRLIQEQLEDIGKLELTSEEKAQIIRRQLHEIQELHKQIETQREDIHALLWDLMKDILKKGQKERERWE